jgi:hypothetical protein
VPAALPGDPQLAPRGRRSRLGGHGGLEVAAGLLPASLLAQQQGAPQPQILGLVLDGERRVEALERAVELARHHQAVRQPQRDQHAVARAPSPTSLAPAQALALPAGPGRRPHGQPLRQLGARPPGPPRPVQLDRQHAEVTQLEGQRARSRPQQEHGLGLRARVPREEREEPGRDALEVGQDAGAVLQRVELLVRGRVRPSPRVKPHRDQPDAVERGRHPERRPVNLLEAPVVGAHDQHAVRQVGESGHGTPVAARSGPYVRPIMRAARRGCPGC